MEPEHVNDLFLTCKTIVDTEIRGHCDKIIEKLNILIPLTKKKAQRKRLKKMKKKVKKICKLSYEKF